ncbi:MAG TPA: hypothetical protein VIH60_00995 [Steroidobacteraceae bacterium]
MSAQHEPGALLLTSKQQAIVEIVNAARVVPEWQQIFTAEQFETDMLDAIDARDVPKMVRVGLDFITRVAAGEIINLLDRQHERHVRAGRLGAERKKGRPSPGALRLANHERRTGVKITKVTRELADQLSLSTSQVRRLRNRKSRPAQH